MNTHTQNWREKKIYVKQHSHLFSQALGAGLRKIYWPFFAFLFEICLSFSFDPGKLSVCCYGGVGDKQKKFVFMYFTTAVGVTLLFSAVTLVIFHRPSDELPHKPLIKQLTEIIPSDFHQGWWRSTSVSLSRFISIF